MFSRSLSRSHFADRHLDRPDRATDRRSLVMWPRISKGIRGTVQAREVSLRKLLPEDSMTLAVVNKTGETLGVNRDNSTSLNAMKMLV